MQIQLIEAKKIEPYKIMQFRQEFIEYGETSINGSRGLHHFDNYEEWIKKVLLTCGSENLASQKTILKCSGVLERKEINVYHGKEIWTNYYWINL